MDSRANVARADPASQEPTMQTQRRTPTPSVQSDKNGSAQTPRRSERRSAPVELDARQLRQVAGGTSLPAKTW
jgi:hypothetical protein